MVGIRIAKIASEQNRGLVQQWGSCFSLGLHPRQHAGKAEYDLGSIF